MIRNLISEALQLINEVHPSIERAFATGIHPLAGHPIFKKHGQALSKDQYANLKTQYHQRTGKGDFDPHDLMRVYQQITQIEAQHQEQLERLAINIVSKVWKIDPSLIKKAEITDNVQLDDDNIEDDVDDQLTPEQQAEVEKRITMNMLTHGSAIHIMTTMYHLGKEALDDIDPRLTKLYDRFTTGAVLSSWYQDIETLLKLVGIQKGGSETVTWDDDVPKIEAQAVMFPLLLHELSKGVMELLTAHQLSNLEPDTLKKVYKAADKYEHEFFHFFVGPAVWRKFLQVVPKDKMAEVIAALSKLKPNDVTAVIDAVIEDKGTAQTMLARLVEDPENLPEEL